MSEYDSNQIQTIRAPTLVVHAREDTLVPFERGVLTAQKGTGAQMIELEKGGHLAPMINTCFSS